MRCKYLTLVCIAELLLAHLSESYNILVIFGHPGKSHYDVFRSLFEVLSERGHNLTILSHVHIKNTKNIKHVPLAQEGPLLHVMNVADTHVSRPWYYYNQGKLLADLATSNCLRDLQSVNFQKFLREDGQFDLVIAEMFNTNCYYGLINKYKVPLIGLSSCSHISWQMPWFGVTPNPAYMQHILGGFKTPMTFWSRVENTLQHIFADAWYKFQLEIPGREWSKKYIGYDVPDPHNASLILVNTHYTIDGVKPLTPNIIEVGGIHVENRKPKKLPEDIEKWVNNSDAGVIYFSLGSMIKGDTFPEEQRKAFARAFAKLPQRILWKWENDSMQDKPDNVMTGKWMPQFDILCHPNVKLFISHGGLLGTIEAVHCGVPIIVMPQFGDQRHNAYAIENNGVGVILHLQSATEEMITEALHKALDPHTLKNAKALSEKFRDRPLSSMDTAVYWVEHVARHKGARHMRSPAVDMAFYQYLLLDVLAFIILILSVLFYVTYKAIRLTIRVLSSTSRREKQKVP